MLLDITGWWNALDSFEKIIWAIALIFSLLFIVQTIMSFIGGDSSDTDSIGDSDEAIGEDEGVGTQYFTIKNLIAFFTMFGWAGIAAYSSGYGKGVSILIALLAGLAMVALMILLLRNVGRLKESGTLEINNAIGKLGETYLPIPAKNEGTGKVRITIQNSLHEIKAVTEDELTIPTGKLVKVLRILNNEILVVTAQVS